MGRWIQENVDRDTHASLNKDANTVTKQSSEDEIIAAAENIGEFSEEARHASTIGDMKPASCGSKELGGCSGDTNLQHHQVSSTHDKNSALDSSGHSALKMAQNGGKSNFSKIADEKAVAMPAIKALSEPSAAQFDLNSQGYGGPNDVQSGFLNMPGRAFVCSRQLRVL